jgi:hypothetical protein
MKKSQATMLVAQENSKEIRRPKKISNLQQAMGLSDDKKMYTFCRVSPLFLDAPI